MDLGITGKVAVVTGGSAGLGEATARALAAEGVKLALFARSADKLNAVAADIERSHNVPVLAVAGDMRSKDDVERLATSVEQKFGAPDILILNTGRPPRSMKAVLEETDDARWEDAYQTQLWGAVLVTRRIVPTMLDKGWGRVIAITSASVRQPMLRHGLSTIFRAGVTGFMKHLANEVAAKGITVNTVGPGSIDTDAPRNPHDAAERLKRVPLGRLGRPEEFAATVAFLASQQAGFITGATLHVDGGTMAGFY